MQCIHVVEILKDCRFWGNWVPQWAGTPLEGSCFSLCSCLPRQCGGRGNEWELVISIYFSVSEMVIGLHFGCQPRVGGAISISWKIISSKCKFICFDMGKIMSSYCFTFLYICNVIVFISHFKLWDFYLFFFLSGMDLLVTFFIKSAINCSSFCFQLFNFWFLFILSFNVLLNFL